MPRTVKLLAVVIALMFVSTSAVLVLLRATAAQPAATSTETTRPDQNHSDPARPTPAAESLRFPTFTLTTQEGSAYTHESLRGQITIVDFTFTNCPFICPMLIEQMKKLADQLKGTNVKFLSISVDPTNDTPTALLAHAQKHQIDLSRWTFAVGTPEITHAIVREGLQFELSEDPQVQIDLPGGGKMSNIAHPSWFVLVGADAQVLGVYMSSVPEDMAAIAERARLLDRRLKR